MASPRWRIQCRRNGVVFQEASGPGPAGELVRVLFEKRAVELQDDPHANVELQERAAGARRFHTLEQAVGKERIKW